MFCSGRGKKCALIEKTKDSWQRNVVMMTLSMKFICAKEDEDKTRQDNGQNWFLFLSKMPFWGIYYKISTFCIWCMVIPIGPHLVYT
jgi:hypothetical protein